MFTRNGTKILMETKAKTAMQISDWKKCVEKSAEMLRKTRVLQCSLRGSSDER